MGRPLIGFQQGVFHVNRSRFKKCVTLALSIALIFGLASHYRQPDANSNSVFAPARFSGETVVIDAGHGGEDGGAVSVSGAVESQINLAIALRLDQVLGLFGVTTVLLRDSDVSLHDADAQTLRQKKVSDLQNRVAAIEALEDPVVISIHQNTYSSSQYHGAQVFYANGDLSLPLAQITQETLRQTLDPDNQRQPAAVPESVYLMNHISCRAVLVECGFLSNPQEDKLLQTPGYQTKLAAALAGAYLNYQQTNAKGETPHAS